jgi:nitrate reductase NapE component
MLWSATGASKPMDQKSNIYIFLVCVLVLLKILTNEDIVKFHFLITKYQLATGKS